MAAAAAAAAATQIFQNNKYSNNKGNGNGNENEENSKVSREEVQEAIAKAVELRALHAALIQGSSPSNLRFPSSSPTSQFSAQDYPVFTPSYEDEPLPAGYHQVPIKSRTVSECWDEYSLGGGGNGIDSILSDYQKETSTSRNGLISLEPHICPSEDHKSVTSSTTNHITVLQTSPGNNFFKFARRRSLGDCKSVSSCNRCKPALITKESENAAKNSKHSNIVVPLTDSHSSTHPQPKTRGVISWLFPRLKKKHKNEMSLNRTESEDVSQVFKEFGIISIETLKRELIEANEMRDAAVVEVSEMKTSLGELKQKLEYLETYCEELKRSLRQTTKVSGLHVGNKLNENVMPVSEEVMVEGFLQIVSESRLAVKQFCKTLVSQIEETDITLTENLNSILRPYKISINNSKYSKAVFYHFEALINQTLFQDFENVVFQKNGSPKSLDPWEDRQAQFSSFVALRNLSWNEVLRKGTKYYSEEFSKFCDQKMSCIITTLNWTRPWHEQLLQAFFVAAKCIWLLHLLAFSFDQPIGILRVEENRSFDQHYMEDMLIERQQKLSGSSSRVKIMVMPGFYVHDRVVRCKVLCRYNKSVP